MSPNETVLDMVFTKLLDHNGRIKDLEIGHDLVGPNSELFRLGIPSATWRTRSTFYKYFEFAIVHILR